MGPGIELLSLHLEDLEVIVASTHAATGDGPGLKSPLLQLWRRLLRSGSRRRWWYLHFHRSGDAAIFDSMASSGATRKKVTLNCGVWGIFPDNSLTPIKTNLNIEIFDDICCLDLDSWINLWFFLPGCF